MLEEKSAHKGAQKSLLGVATVVVVGKANAPVAETTENQVLTAAASTYQNRTPQYESQHQLAEEPLSEDVHGHLIIEWKQEKQTQ